MSLLGRICRRPLFSAAVCLLLLAVSAVPAEPEGVGKKGIVRINNPNRFPVQILAQNRDFFGRKRWVRIGVVRPRSFIQIPNVPMGATLGANAVDGSRYWRPFRVTYPRRGGALYTRTLHFSSSIPRKPPRR